MKRECVKHIPFFFVFFFAVIKYLRIFAGLKIDNTLKS